MGNSIPARAGQLPAVGARRRLRALAYLGHDVDTLAAWCGTDPSTIDCLLRARHCGVAPDVDARTVEVFERYCMTLGDSTTTAEWAHNHHWVSGLAWYDIDMDDATAKPDRGPTSPAEFVEVDVQLLMAGEMKAPGGLYGQLQASRDEAIRRLTALGVKANIIAARIGCTDRTVVRTRTLHRQQAAQSAPQRNLEVAVA